MLNKVLPDPFTDLEPFVDAWVLATETERNQKRLTSSMTEIQAFYDAMLPRMEAVLYHLDSYNLTATFPAHYSLVRMSPNASGLVFVVVM
jgi:hypothetical protein